MDIEINNKENNNNNNLMILSEKKINIYKELIKSSELIYFILLNLFSKFEKIQWKQLIILKLHTCDKFFLKRYVIFLFIWVSFIVGYIHDKYDFFGFKLFLNLGNIINIIISIIYFFLHKYDNKTIDILLSYINLFFVGNYYAIMLPELIRKYGIKYIFEVSGFIGLTNLISRFIEIFFTIYVGNINGIMFYIIMFLQIISSILGILLIQMGIINSNQFQFDLYSPSNENITINPTTVINTELIINNRNDNERTSTVDPENNVNTSDIEQNCSFESDK